MQSGSRRLVFAAVVFASCSGSSTSETKTESKTVTNSEVKTEVKTDVKTVEVVDAKKDANVEPKADGSSWAFDEEKPGAVPAFVKPMQAGEPSDPPTWEVVAEPTAPSPPNAFGVTKSSGPGKAYYIGLMPDTSWKDVDITVSLRALAGTNTQGGGVVFRAKSERDHYIARWNPVEKNFRIYALVGGARVDIGSAELDLDTSKWHTLRVVVQGDSIECFMDDDPVLQVNDKTFTDAGMIGVWTKGDSTVLFDDLSVATP